jgi:hypothetical protein
LLPCVCEATTPTFGEGEADNFKGYYRNKQYGFASCSTFGSEATTLFKISERYFKGLLPAKQPFGAASIPEGEEADFGASIALPSLPKVELLRNPFVASLPKVGLLLLLYLR